MTTKNMSGPGVMSYQHTQSGTLIVAAMLAAAILVVVPIGCFLDPHAFLIAPILLVTCWAFSSLTVEITDTELRWHFGPGLIHKRIRLADIASAKPVRTNFLEGWGIHYSRFGWLYNVSGCDAVAITLHTGKRFALGTDEPQALLRQLPDSRA